jgi:RHS repeat-associated protein
VNSIAYRAFGMKQMAYANGKTLSLSYDNRLRLAGWDIPGVMGWTYAYDTPSIHENTQRVAFANNLYDHTLDRSYDYDAVGRMWASHTGAEARGHAGYAAWGPKDGPYAENYTFDQLGNMTWRNGWGVANAQYNYAPQFVNNKMTVNPVTGASVGYDAAGNLTNDGSQSYSYDATGQQSYASGIGGGATPAFTNDPLAVGVTEVKALHITELRTAINQVRAGVGLAAYSWTYSVTTNDWITANPILEMRTALDQALGAPTPAYSAGLAAAQPILAIHIQELRERIKTAFSTSALNQYYDGDRLRGKKTEYGATTYYVRSSVLGGQVVAELNGSGGWNRGYVYLGGQLLAVQYGGVYWVHQDPVTKSQRVTNSSGAVVSTIDLDPWGGETNRSASSAFQPHKYTTYERDANGGDDAMMRRYQSNWTRFSQPDPYDGSYDATNPQSFNRYSYVQNDPVNFTDPTGLFCIQREHWDEKTATLYVSWDCYLEGGGGGGGASVMPTGGGGSIEPRGGGGGGVGPQNPNPPNRTQSQPPRTIKQKICGVIPSGRTVGASGALGLLGGPTGGGEVVINYNSGQISAFAFGGAQVGWNGAASGSINSGFVYGLNDSNSNYSRGFTGVGGSAGGGGFLQSSSGGLSNGAKGLIPNPRAVTVGGGSVGASLLGGFSGGVSATHYTKPLQLGRWGGLIGLSPLDAPFYAARQLCK